MNTDERASVARNIGLRFGWVRVLHAITLGCLIALLWARNDGTNRGEYVVVIDPGHGGTNIGAVTREGLLEKDLTLDVGLRLRELLSRRTDVRVVLTRTEDRSLALWDRRDASNDHRADLFVSIHFNGSRNKTVNRSEVFYSRNVSREPAQTFGELVESAVGLHHGFVRKVHWTVLWKNRARLGAMLVEIMYLSHPTADDFLADIENRDVIAQGLQQAVDTLLDAETHRRATRRKSGIFASLGNLF